MNDSLKLSYDMLFENNENLEEGGSESGKESETFSREEVEKRLAEKEAQWQERLEQERSDAEEAGFRKGYDQGKEDAEQRCLERIAGFEKMMQQLDREFKQAMEELKPHIASLVFDITEKVLNLPLNHPQLQQRVLKPHIASLVFDITEKVLNLPLNHPQLQQRVQEETSQLVENLDDELQVKMVLSEADIATIREAFENHQKADYITLRSDGELNPGEYIIETKKECIIKNFKKMVADFRQSVSFSDIENMQLKS